MSVPGSDLLSEIENDNPKLGILLRRYVWPAIQSRGRAGHVLATPPDAVGDVQLTPLDSLAAANNPKSATYVGTNAAGSLVVAPTPGAGTVTAVTGTAPIGSTGGPTPDITVAKATVGGVGVVKPDGSSITIATDGTISAVPVATGVASVSGATSGGFAVSVTSPTTTPVVSVATDGTHYLPTATDQSNWNAKQAAGSYITALTGDVTASGPGSSAATLASTAVTPGAYTNANITVDAKGRLTAAANGTAATGTVTTTGTPASGNLTKFSGATSVTSGDLTGDVTTSGTLATSVVKVNGASLPTSAAYVGTDASGKIVAASAPPGSGGVSAKTSSYVAVSGDAGKLLSFNSASAVTLTLPATPPSSTWMIFVENTGSGTLTVSRNGLNIDGAAINLSLLKDQGVSIFTDGSNYFTTARSASVLLKTGGTANGSQAVLNLVAGTNVTLTDGGSGNVTIASSVSTGGGGFLNSGSGSPSGSAFVQSASIGGHSLAFASNVASGNLIVVSFSSEGSVSGITVSDTVGTSYALAASSTGHSVNLAVYYGVAPASGANTVSVAGFPNSFDRIGIAEFSGLSAVVDATTVLYNAAGTNPQNVTITTATVNDMIFAGVGAFHNVNTFTFAGGFSLDSQSNGQDACAVGHSFVGSAATYTLKVTYGGAAGDNSPIVLVAFKSSAGSSTPGVDGNFYLDVASKALWGPRAGGAYPLIGTLN